MTVHVVASSHTNLYTVHNTVLTLSSGKVYKNHSGRKVGSTASTVEGQLLVKYHLIEPIASQQTRELAEQSSCPIIM